MEIDPFAPRFIAVEQPVPVSLAGEGCLDGMRSTHPWNPDLGRKEYRYSSELWIDQEDANGLQEGQMITLMHYSNAVIETVSQSHVCANLNRSSDFKRTRKISWIAAADDSVHCVLIQLDHAAMTNEISFPHELHCLIRAKGSDSAAHEERIFHLS